jgi:hypothetical protein
MLTTDIFDVLICVFIKTRYQSINIMANETLQMIEQDNRTIDIKDAWEVLWFCRTLGITKSQLEYAINKVGDTVMDIRRHFAYAA